MESDLLKLIYIVELAGFLLCSSSSRKSD